MRIYKMSLLVAIVALAIGGQASAANLLTNPGFEVPIGAEWTITEVLETAPCTWTIGNSGLRVKSGTQALRMAYGVGNPTGKAYVQQVVTGLTPGVQTTVKGWINLDWKNLTVWAYIEAIGGGATVRSPAKDTNLDDVWGEYTLSQTADAGGNLTVRLYTDKWKTTAALDKTAVAYFDDISVEVIPEPSSMIALLSGLPIIGFAIRRRKA